MVWSRSGSGVREKVRIQPAGVTRCRAKAKGQDHKIYVKIIHADDSILSQTQSRGYRKISKPNPEPNN
jgi:hypothetical protein